MKIVIAIEPGTQRTAHGVAVPDLPGCFSAGDSIEEAFDNAAQAIELHCEWMAEYGGDLPTLKTMTVHRADRDYKDWGIEFSSASGRKHLLSFDFKATPPARR